MRSPSARVLINRADIYVAPRGRDTEGGVTFPYSTSATYSQVPCTIQAQEFGQIDDQQRLTQIITYKVMFGTPYTLHASDKIVYTDASNVTRTLFVEAGRDEAGRGAAFTFHCTERI